MGGEIISLIILLLLPPPPLLVDTEFDEIEDCLVLKEFVGVDSKKFSVF
jgi:hypothetical protein